MSITAYTRGHQVYYHEVSGEWRYLDTDEKADYSRPCTKCGELPTPEGYDACLGYVPDVVSACCGHGVEKPYVMWDWHKRPLRWAWDRLGIAFRNNCQITSEGELYINLGLVELFIG